MRYVCQQAEDDTFYEEYWGEWATWAGQECGTACISMALSYLGIDAEPKDLAEWWISRMGFFGAVFRDVPEAQAQEQVPFFQAWDNYVGGQGLYSPVVLRLPPELNPYQTGNSHYVLVLGQYEDGAWAAADPAVPELLRLFIREDGLSYQVEVETADGTILSGKGGIPTSCSWCSTTWMPFPRRSPQCPLTPRTSCPRRMPGMRGFPGRRSRSPRPRRLRR